MLTKAQSNLCIKNLKIPTHPSSNSTQTLSRSQISSPLYSDSPRIRINFLIHILTGQVGRTYKSGLQVYTEQIFTHQPRLLHHRKPASSAPGSFDAAAVLVGWDTGETGAAGARGVAVGMLTNCSLRNSFNLHGKGQSNPKCCVNRRITD